MPPAEKGLPAIAVNAPVTPAMVYADMLLEPLLATKRNLPLGSKADPAGLLPVGKGPPGTGISDPVLGSMVYADTVFPVGSNT